MDREIKKVIPCIDIQSGKAVKGVSFEGIKEVGSIVDLAVKYALSGADELIFLDISADASSKVNNVNWIKEVVERVDIPITVGGGIQSLQDATQLFDLGVSKVSIGSAALVNPTLIQELVTTYGSEAVVVSIDSKPIDNQWMVFSGGGQVNSGKELFDWAKEVESLGAGSLLFTSIANDGAQKGYAIKALAKLKSTVAIPVIASGGAGNIEHFVEALTLGKADAVLAASLFHYDKLGVEQLKFALRSEGIVVNLEACFTHLIWDKEGLLPAIIQDTETDTVLMLGYMNQESLSKTLADGKVTFYSRSRNKLWTKGEESGNFLNLVEMRADCDRDALLVKVNPVGPVCHLGSDSCWREENKNKHFLYYLEEVIKARSKESADISYTSALFQAGKEKIAQKVGEEAVELVIEALGDDDQLFLNEAADLMYHYLVLLQERGFGLRDVIAILKDRHK